MTIEHVQGGVRSALCCDQRRAFTLIELLIVVAIIAVLASLILAGIARVRYQQRVLATENIILAMKAGIEHYLADELAFGDALTGTFEIDDPVSLLTVRRVEDGDEELLDTPRPEMLVRVSTDDYRQPLADERGTHRRDAWSGPILVQVVNDAPVLDASRIRTKEVRLRSLGQDAESLRDDIVWVMDLDAGTYVKRRLLAVEDDGAWTLEE